MGRCWMVIMFPKIGYNKYLSYINRVISILNLEQHSERVPFGDVPSHPTLVETCFTFISFSIAAPDLGSLETFPPTPGYARTCYFINDQHHGYGWTTKNPCHRSPFARTHVVSITVGQKHYMVFLSLDLHFSWLWVIQKPILHWSPFARPHTVNITVGHKHYKVSLSSDLRSSRLWVNHTKTFYLVNLHIQQRLLKRQVHALGTISS